MRRFLMRVGSAIVLVAAMSQAAHPQAQSESAAKPAPDPTTPAAKPQLEMTAKLGSGIEERELVEERNTFHVGDEAILWMRLVGGPSDPVTVTWTIDEHSYDVHLDVGGASWRTWSSKTLWKAGGWSVEVRDAAGTSLQRIAFDVMPAE